MTAPSLPGRGRARISRTAAAPALPGRRQRASKAACPVRFAAIARTRTGLDLSDRSRACAAGRQRASKAAT